MGKGRTTLGFRAAEIARAQGATRYFTGLPCTHGHVAERLTVNGTCTACLKMRRQANPEWCRRANAKQRQKPEVRARKLASERRCRKAPHRQATRAAERMARIAEQLQRTPKWADLKEIKKFYDEMHRLTRETGLQHHVDHVIPLKGRQVSGLHIAENLRVILATSNLSKGSKFII